MRHLLPSGLCMEIELDLPRHGERMVSSAAMNSGKSVTVGVLAVSGNFSTVIDVPVGSNIPRVQYLVAKQVSAVYVPSTYHCLSISSCSSPRLCPMGYTPQDLRVLSNLAARVVAVS